MLSSRERVRWGQVLPEQQRQGWEHQEEEGGLLKTLESVSRVVWARTVAVKRRSQTQKSMEWRWAGRPCQRPLSLPCFPFHLPPCLQGTFFIKGFYPRRKKTASGDISSHLAERQSPLQRRNTPPINNPEFSKTQELAHSSCLASVPLILPLRTENSFS